MAERGRRLIQVLGWLGLSAAAVAAIAHLLLLVWIVANRLTFPLDLEWMEGGMLGHALRVMEGKPIYAKPSVAFIPYLYTPGYPYTLAALGKVFGLSYLLGRLVSLAGFAAACIVLFKAVLNESRAGFLGRFARYAFATVAVGLFAASFPHTGAWYDLVRNDSLYLGLVSTALYLIRYHHHSWAKVALAGVLLGLGFLTKQTTSVFVLFAGAAMLLFDWRKLLLLVPTVGAVAGGAVLLGNWLTDGWMWRYIFELHQGHDVRADWLWPKTELRLLKLMPANASVVGGWLISGLLVLVFTRRWPDPERRRSLYWFALMVVGVAVSAIGFSTQWAVENAFIPGFYFAALFAAVAMSQMATLAGGRSPFWAGVLVLLAGAGLAVQLFAQLYSPAKHLPTARARGAVAPFLSELRKHDGPLLVPYHPFYPYLLGKATSYHQMGINDITRAGYPIPRALHQRFASQYYGAVVLDSSPRHRPDYGPLLNHYKFAHYFAPDQSPTVVTGYRVRPRYLLVPKKEAKPPPKGATRIFDFEDGSYDGWQVKGSAFGRKPAGGKRGNQHLAGPYSGRFMVSSYAFGDRATGEMLSPEFEVDGSRLVFRFGGGRDSRTLYLRLLVQGKEVHRTTGDRTHIMRKHEVDVRQYRGEKMRVELVDQASGSWGHVLFDELMLIKD